jgi:DNA-directed RNA polymerase specialized sigma24 family protein
MMVSCLPDRIYVPLNIDLKRDMENYLRLNSGKGRRDSEIATQLGLPEGTVKSHVSRGMKLLRRLIGIGRKDAGNEPKVQRGYFEDPTELAARIDQLPEPYQTAVRLHHLKKLTYPEVAAQLHLPKGTVKSHVSRGMKLLSDL